MPPVGAQPSTEETTSDGGDKREANSAHRERVLRALERAIDDALAAGRDDDADALRLVLADLERGASA